MFGCDAEVRVARVGLSGDPSDPARRPSGAQSWGLTCVKVVLATFSELPMSRTDVVGVPVWACRTLSGGVRPQIAGSYLPPDAPKLAQASKMVVLTHLSDDRS